ncbi:hypothetical protein M422DRAFT_191355 [Sphaerobolus stellatus SS14]|uniref:G domain-containing protein n=1 Tax=Sphaerobolus stellatus (strain SS14) TaxID=990650 RepID=A0A0C9TD68_SPHS4|nr:hypothetical protein M422DRAFT_191355 [Sphaerobolus stellatus SS14]
MHSSSETAPVRDQKLRAKFSIFRILVLGRANAGKTTILQKVCNTSEEPEIFDANGKTIYLYILTADASKRGAHDIDRQLVFKSNPGFIFHDSRGFESGGDCELGIVQDFIAQRARERRISKQLHAIWYCIPVDNSRPVTAAEERFFSNCGTGKVPVVAVFTKMDALDSKAWNKLLKKNMSLNQAKQQAQAESLSTAKTYFKDLCQKKYPPKGTVYLRDMNVVGPECNKLIEETVSVLDDPNLQLILVSTQQVTLELCIRYAVTKYVLN